jgi:hypothetical protein
MVAIESTHIQITLRCSECGYEWDVDDHDSNSIDAAEISVDKTCSNCKE